MTKINAAYAFGVPKLMTKTVEQNTGLDAHADAEGALRRVKRQRKLVSAMAKKAASPAGAFNPAHYWRFAQLRRDSLAVGDSASMVSMSRMGLAMSKVSGSGRLTLTVPSPIRTATPRPRPPSSNSASCRPDLRRPPVSVTFQRRSCQRFRPSFEGIAQRRSAVYLTGIRTEGRKRCQHEPVTGSIRKRRGYGHLHGPSSLKTCRYPLSPPSYC